MMFTEVVSAEYMGDYRIRLKFNDNVVKTVNLAPWLRGVVFEPLKNVDFFKRFSVRFNTIEWENGADLAPEFLYSLPDV